MIINHQDLLEKYIQSEVFYITDWAERCGHSELPKRKELLIEVTEYVTRYNTYNKDIIHIPQVLIDICQN